MSYVNIEIENKHGEVEKTHTTTLCERTANLIKHDKVIVDGVEYHVKSKTVEYKTHQDMLSSSSITITIR